MPVNLSLYEGKTALITGASTGIGRAFAEALAERGTHLLLVTPSAEHLQALATALARLHAVSVEVLVVDLSQEGAANRISAAVEQLKRRVDILINNDEFATQGAFDPLAPEGDHEQVMHYVVAVTDLTHAFLPAMLARGRGMVINVASLAAFQPMPHMAVYGATKAFLLSFSQALWAECHERGVRILALCPLTTNPRFFEAVGLYAVTPGPKSPSVVVAHALRALEQGRSSVVPGFFIALLVRFLWKLTPMSALARRRERALRSTATKREDVPLPPEAEQWGMRYGC
jgi:uncharacterized protein